ncbi:MAG TPA: hypothetical protein DCE23_05940 [Firmicutes bacterium]|nr:hypothetical protein [Bacillota bacterium]
MDGEELIKSIESVTVRDMNWYYHAYQGVDSTYRLKRMLLEGIKCRLLLYDKRDLYGPYSYTFAKNGFHYISLSKDIDALPEKSSFLHYLNEINFIIDHIFAFKCSTKKEYERFRFTALPLRSSGYHDEYQVYRHISPKHFVGLQCSLLNWYYNGYTFRFADFKKLLTIMNEEGIDLPIYDYSRVIGDNVHVVDKSAFLEIYPKIQEDIKQKCYSKSLKEHRF